jgi:large subunit ribosomal protein L24
MKRKLHIKKGDSVIVNTGEYKGHQGKVLEVDKKNYKALVEGANMRSKHTKPDANNTKGGIIKKEVPIHLSNLMLVDPSTGEATRVGRKKDDSNKNIRFSKKSEEEIK